MTRHVIVALIVSFGLAAAGHAQSRPMPAYQDDERYAPQTSSDDDASSRAARRDAGYPANYGDPSTKRSGDRQDEYTDYDNVPPPIEDAAHRSDRLRTTELNRRASGRPTYGTDSRSQDDYARQSAQYRAELADHERAMHDYSDERARYADRLTRWRARVSACQAGDIDACQGPE